MAANTIDRNQHANDHANDQLNFRLGKPAKPRMNNLEIPLRSSISHNQNHSSDKIPNLDVF